MSKTFKHFLGLLTINYEEIPLNSGTLSPRLYISRNKDDENKLQSLAVRIILSNQIILFV